MRDAPIRSYAQANSELALSFERYMISRGYAAPTRRSYVDTIARLVEFLGAASVAEAERAVVRELLTRWYRGGITRNTARVRICGLRSFFKFVRLAGLTKHDPMILFTCPKRPARLPVVLTVAEVERLLAVAQNPFERAVVEVLYATGVRVSELVNLRLENIDFGERTMLVKKGKGNKDRYVLFGSHAAQAIREYLTLHSSPKGFLFESTYRNNSRTGIYTPKRIRELIRELARRAGLGRVHPHALRRAMASHMLQRSANIRAVQDLLGHARLSTTMLYTHLAIDDLVKIHQRCHPHGDGDATEEKQAQ